MNLFERVTIKHGVYRGEGGGPAKVREKWPVGDPEENGRGWA